MNPQKYLESGHLPPWHNHVPDDNKLDYHQIRDAIDEKMSVIKKEFPLQTAVRAMQKRPKFEKKTTTSTWSTKIYYVSNYRRPRLPTEDVGIRLKDLKG